MSHETRGDLCASNVSFTGFLILLLGIRFGILFTANEKVPFQTHYASFPNYFIARVFILNSFPFSFRSSDISGLKPKCCGARRKRRKRPKNALSTTIGQCLTFELKTEIIC